MQETFFCAVWREHVGHGPLQRLLDVFPEGCRDTASIFRCELKWNDPRAQRLIEVLNDSGLKAWPGIASMACGEYELIRRRDYEPSDFEAHPWMVTASRWGSDFTLAARRPDGRLEMESRFFKRRIFLESNFTPSLIVSRQVRQWLEEAGLAGMLFRPTAKEKGRGAAEEDNLWELTAEHVLPPMSPSCTWFDPHGNPTDGGNPDEGRILKEGFCRPVEFHYLGSSLRQLPASDFFQTWERFWQSGARQERRLVVSRRFYEFCKAKQLKMEWIPVRIDPD